MSPRTESGVKAWRQVQRQIETCQLCPRLIAYGKDVARTKRKAFQAESYWGKPVPDLGEAPASLLIVGLAPAAHGAHRTGRMFTGDQSGRWLYRALHNFGFAETDGWEKKSDNRLIDTVITAVAHCAPPDNKPTREEILNCRVHLEQGLDLVQPRAVLCLGKIAWDAISTQVRRSNSPSVTSEQVRIPSFAHGAQYMTSNFDAGPKREVFVLGSYHPSQQNTFTGRLNEDMFDEIFRTIRRRLGPPLRAEGL